MYVQAPIKFGAADAKRFEAGNPTIFLFVGHLAHTALISTVAWGC